MFRFITSLRSSFGERSGELPPRLSSSSLECDIKFFLSVWLSPDLSSTNQTVSTGIRYQLKGQPASIGQPIPDGAYAAMMEAIRLDAWLPTLCLCGSVAKIRIRLRQPMLHFPSSILHLRPNSPSMPLRLCGKNRNSATGRTLHPESAGTAERYRSNGQKTRIFNTPPVF